MDARVHGARVRWEAAAPGTLAYDREDGGRGSAAELRVVQRAVEAPSDQGWGSSELVRITTSTGGLLGQPGFESLRRARAAATAPRRGRDGERVVEGLEIVKTYRVLDGVAGVEFPTSTTKSTLRLTGPSELLAKVAY